jgi:hypothetical protein
MLKYGAMIASDFRPTPPGGWVLLAAADLDGNTKPDYLQPRHASNSDLVSE